MLPATYKMWKERQVLCKGWANAPRGFRYSQKSAIFQSAQWLIERLYVPCSLSRHPWGTIVKHPNKLTLPYDVEREAINWGDLHVVDVQRLGRSGWLVSIEEASPECPNFCAYIQTWLTKWGWQNVIVQTEW